VLEWAVVKTVVDGDTLTTEEGDKVRLIGINTPEKNEDLYDDAKGYLTALLRGKKIGLETDVEKLDQYQRRLCYVFLDGRFVNGDLVRRGYAHVYRWEPNLKHLKALRYLQQQALGEKLGLWSLPAPEPSPEYVGRSDDHAFHRLSCPRTRLFPAKLRVSFPSREAAFDDGRRACSSCKP
jgi:endonuclease YncB( thermonuclease family)